MVMYKCVCVYKRYMCISTDLHLLKWRKQNEINLHHFYTFVRNRGRPTTNKLLQQYYNLTTNKNKTNCIIEIDNIHVCSTIANYYVFCCFTQ